MALIHTEKIISPDGTITIREVKDDSKIMVNKKEKLGSLSDFVFVFQKAISEIVLSGKLGKNEYRVLLYLMGKTEFEKEINITPYQIAKELGMQQSPTGSAIRGLAGLNILIRDKKLKTFRLNYEIGFKGSPKNYTKLKFKDKPILEIGASKQRNLLDSIEEVEGESYE